MCDYSLNAVKTRPAKVDDKLTTRLFGWSTRGFAASEDRSVAVCLLPGTELSFAEEVRKVRSWPWRSHVGYKTAIFRKINQHNPTVHHDALEFPDGQIVLLTLLEEGQQATVLQLPVMQEGARASEPEKARVS
jgi:hypothetical protein